MGVDAVVWVGAAVVVAAVALLLLVVAPWRSVRDEPPLDDDIETRLLLGEDPATVALDADADGGRATDADANHSDEG